MPPRLNKRQQRELEELEALNAAKASTTFEDDATDEEEEAEAIPQRRGGFSNVRSNSLDEDPFEILIFWPLGFYTLLVGFPHEVKIEKFFGLVFPIVENFWVEKVSQFGAFYANLIFEIRIFFNF